MGKGNESLAREKNLIIDNDKTKYADLQKKYKYLLEYYLHNKINFKKYEDLIDNSNLFIGKNAKYRSLNEYLNLNYLFLINNLFVEKLSIEDINLILTKFNKDVVDDELINLVERTFKDVIYDNYMKGEYQSDIYKVCYGAFIPSNFVDNDALVFKIYYGKNLIDLSGQEFVDLHKKQLEFFTDIINQIKEEVKNTLNVNCEVLLEKDIY